MKNPVITEVKEFVLLKSDDNTDALQISVSDFVFKAILTAEISFRLYRERTVRFTHTDVHQYFVENLMYVWNGSGIPNCHDLERKILKTFFDGRLKEFGKIRREKHKEDNANKPIQKNSKTVAGHEAASQKTVTGAHRSQK